MDTPNKETTMKLTYTTDAESQKLLSPQTHTCEGTYEQVTRYGQTLSVATCTICGMTHAKA